MQVSISTASLKKALETVNKASQPTVSSNVYEGIYMYAHDSLLEIQANNHYIGIRTEVPATVKEKGKVVILAAFVVDLVKKISAENVELVTDEENKELTIKGGRSVYKVVLGHPEEFPEIDNIDDTAKVVIHSDQLKDMFDLTQFAVAGDNQKPIFSGLLLEVDGAAARMVATDTHRLACREVALAADSGKQVQLIIPQPVLNDFVRLLPGEEEVPVTIYWARDRVAFAFDNVYFRGSLIGGEYPDYNRVFPQQFQAHATLNRRDFTAALERVALVSRDMTYKTVAMDWQSGLVKLNAAAVEFGSVDEEVPCEFTGEPLQIVFNCFYLLDILKRSAGDTVTLHILANGPMLVEQEFDKLYRYVVTPMRGH